MTTTIAFDQNHAEEFAGRLIDVLNSAGSR